MRTQVIVGLWLVAGLALAGGCSKQPYYTAERLDKGLVVVFTGIEGRSPFNEQICKGLVAGGIDEAVKLEDWTVGVPGAYLLTLRAKKRNRDKAAEIAEDIAKYQLQYPGRPVYLVGQSGGGAMAIWVAEAIPFQKRVDGVILLAAAIAPDYRLDRALFKSRRGIINFYSESDWLFLGMGTYVFGTMEGEHGSSAGRVGFEIPTAEGAMPPSYLKLYQVPWHGQMGLVGHTGGHLASGAAGFVSRFVSPLIRAPRWDSKVIGSVVVGRALTEDEPEPEPTPPSTPAPDSALPPMIP